MKSVDRHSLNTSPAKNALGFLKSPRHPILAQGQGTDRYYDLPSVREKRSCSFGFGNKSSLVNYQIGPPPGNYDIINFVDIAKNRKRSFGYGRDQVVGGALPKKPRESSPGPGQYSTKSYLQNRNIGMGAKLGSSLIASNKDIPGPGTYSHSNATIMKSGGYVISSYKNPGSPSLKSRIHYQNKKVVPGPGNYQYSTTINKQGKQIQSRHRANHSYRFPRSLRPSLGRQSQVPGPGNYPMFSQFGQK